MKKRTPQPTIDNSRPEESAPVRLNARFGHAEAYEPWDHLTPEERDVYRQRSSASALAKARALRGEGPEPVHEVNVPRLDPIALMPAARPNGLASLSLFSGGGGLDLAFERAGFTHSASYEIIDAAAETLRKVRPEWKVLGGEDGDVRRVDWKAYRGSVDVIHGGPPCQPFSSAGRQRGKRDPRDMWPEFSRAVLEAKPEAFVAENVAALVGDKFKRYLDHVILRPLSEEYTVQVMLLKAAWFGVPQIRRRVFFVGFRKRSAAKSFVPPAPTHSVARFDGSGDDGQGSLALGGHAELRPCMGAREALGLPDIGLDDLAPTIRCAWTGPRGTTSVLSSVSALKTWGRLGIWPNGVASNREQARAFVAKNHHFRLAVTDVALLQGFPESWAFNGPVYVALGQIGNAVPPPLGYRVAAAVARALA